MNKYTVILVLPDEEPPTYTGWTEGKSRLEAIEAVCRMAHEAGRDVDPDDPDYLDALVYDGHLLESLR